MNYVFVPDRNSATGTRTRVARVRTEYPNQLDYSGVAVILKPHTQPRAMLFLVLDRNLQPLSVLPFGHITQHLERLTADQQVPDINPGVSYSSCRRDVILLK